MRVTAEDFADYFNDVGKDKIREFLALQKAIHNLDGVRKKEIIYHLETLTIVPGSKDELKRDAYLYIFRENF